MNKSSERVQPLFSIITVCLNNHDGLLRSYESIFAQTCDDFEWIVIDGESTDGTINFLKSLIQNEMIIWVSEKDNGLYDAMNKGINCVTGKYLLFLNSGDELAYSNTLEFVRGVFLESEYDLIYGDALEQKEEGFRNYKAAYSHHRRWYGMFTHHQSIFYKRQIVSELRYDLSYKIAADYAFTCALLEIGLKVKYLEIPICLFEGGGLTSKTSIHIQGVKEQWRISRDILKRSLPKRLSVLILLLGKHILMRISPRLYNRIRYKKVS